MGSSIHTWIDGFAIMGNIAIAVIGWRISRADSSRAKLEQTLEDIQKRLATIEGFLRGTFKF